MNARLLATPETDRVGRGEAFAGLGIMLPTFDPFGQGTPPLLEAAELAEQLEFDSGWIGDHLAFHAPILETTCALAAAAARTSRLKLGTGVLLLGLRHPVWTAKQLGTIGALAPGRLLLGVGVGGENPAEWEAAGIPVRERGRRVDEALEILPPLLRGQPVAHPGPLLQVQSPRLAPVPGEMPPLGIGGRSDAAITRAARAGDAWLPLWLSPERLERGRLALEEQAEALGRQRPSVVVMVFAAVTSDQARSRAEAERFVRGQYGLPFERLERWCLIGDEEDVAAGVAAHRAAGAAGVVLVAIAEDALGQLERFAGVRARLGGVWR